MGGPVLFGTTTERNLTLYAMKLVLLSVLFSSKPRPALGFELTASSVGRQYVRTVLSSHTHCIVYQHRFHSLSTGTGRASWETRASGSTPEAFLLPRCGHRRHDGRSRVQIMRRLLIAAAFPFLTLLPAQGGDLGPADLSNREMIQAFPSGNMTWEADCGSLLRNTSCKITLGDSQLAVNDMHKIDYDQILSTESRDSYAAITRLAKGDPAFTSWQNYRKNNVRYRKNTVLITYTGRDGRKSTAIFAFPENRYSDFYGFANAIRMIAHGARMKKEQLR